MKKLMLTILFFLMAVTGHTQEVSRGLFVWALEKEPVIASQGQIERMIAFAKKEQIDTIFVQMYRANKSWFPSKIADDEPYRHARKQVGQDPVKLLIKAAHAQGIQVHAWMNMLSLSANVDAPLLKKYGTSILTRNKERKHKLSDYKIDNQYFLEPSNRFVRRASLDVVEEIITAYPELDGIQFDYIRYPDVHPFYGYSSDNIVRYKRDKNKLKVVEADPDWKQWKRDQVTELLSFLVKKARSINPKIQVSATGCLSYARAMHEAMQDWPSWINKGLVDFVTVMNYPQDTATYIKNIEGIKSHVNDFKKVNMAVGLYKNIQKPQVFKEHYQACVVSNPKSCVFFHYNNFLENSKIEL